MANDTPEYFKPVEIDIKDYMNEANKQDHSQPYLGLGDLMKPTPDLEQTARTKSAAKTQAFGDVLSSLFDTAVAASGGIVEKDGENKAQLRNLEDYNRDRIEQEAQGRQHKAALLQTMMEEARLKLENERSDKKNRLDGSLQKAILDAGFKDKARADQAEQARYEMIYGKKEDIAEKQIAGANTRAAAKNTGQPKNLPLTGSDGTRYSPVTMGDMNEAFNKIIDAIRSGRIKKEENPGVQIDELMANFSKYDQADKLGVVYKLWQKDPEIAQWLISQSYRGTTSDPAPQTSKPVSQSAAPAQITVIAPGANGSTDLTSIFK